MGRDKKKPDFNNITLGINPFVEDLKISVTKKGYQVLNKYETIDEKQYEFENTAYVKIFMNTASMAKSSGLSVRGKELYLFIIHGIPSATDFIWIDRDVYMRRMGIKSVNTYKEAVKSLSLAGYISAHCDLKDVYWINPKHFYKGNRINKYPNNIEVIDMTLKNK